MLPNKSDYSLMIKKKIMTKIKLCSTYCSCIALLKKAIRYAGFKKGQRAGFKTKKNWV